MILIKYINLGAVFLITFYIGYLLSKRYSQRVLELKELQTALTLLETKIKFTYEPLPEIFLQMEAMLEGSIKLLFKKINEKLKESSLQVAIEEAIKLTPLSLINEDKIILNDLAKTLGKTDKEGQVSQIELSLSFLNSQVKKAEKEEEKNAKLYKTLGATIGMAFAILLF